MNNLIKDIACCERPYEKAKMYGVKVLSDSELLAIILRSGTKTQSSIDLANIVLNLHPLHKGITGLNYLTREELVSINGIGDTKATMLLAIAELSHRMNSRITEKRVIFNNPVTIGEYYIRKCKFLTKEKTYLLMLSSSHELIKEIEISEGTVNQALLSPREVFIEALKYSAVNIILVHNHPSGNPEPSMADIKITKKIQNAGNMLDINLSDHIIVGNNKFVSMRERGIINEI